MKNKTITKIILVWVTIATVLGIIFADEILSRIYTILFIFALFVWREIK